MTNLKFFGGFLALLILISSCQENAIQPNENLAQNEVLNKEELALQVVDLLNVQSSRDLIIAELKGNPVGVSVKNLMAKIEDDKKAVSSLRNSAQQAELLAKDGADKIEIPELWLHDPVESISNSNLLVAFPPSGDESEWTKVKAYTLDKQVVYLDPYVEPSVPVVVVETMGFEALKVEAQLINEMFRKSGLQSNFTMDLKERKASAERSGLETTLLEKIRLKDDKEPWISGAAEIYAVTSGIRNTQNQAELAVIPMYYLDKDGKDYYPNQVMLFWDDYAYQAANIQLFEKDDNHNYKDLASRLIEGVTQIVGTLTGEVWVTALGKIASAVIQAMPDDWWTNDDDYVDSFYTIEKNRYYYSYFGAAGNAKVNMKPYFIPSN